MWQILEPNIETVRRRLAAEFGCDPRRSPSRATPARRCRSRRSASTSSPATRSSRPNQDYGRMLDTWDQRVRRDGIKLTQGLVPGAAAIAGRPGRRAPVARSRRDEGAALLPHHQPDRADLPGAATSATMARARGIKTIVDGAHAFAHFPFKLAATSGCDYYGTSLHKWLLAPIGTGFLYVRRERIADLWPLRPAAESAATTTSASSRRSARTRRRTTTRSPRRSRSTRHRQRAQGGAAALPPRPVGDAAEAAGARQNPHQPGSGALLCDRNSADRRGADGKGRVAGCGIAGGSSPRRSSMPSTRACASPRTFTRPSRRSIPSRRPWKRSSRTAPTDAGGHSPRSPVPPFPKLHTSPLRAKEKMRTVPVGGKAVRRVCSRPEADRQAPCESADEQVREPRRIIPA